MSHQPLLTDCLLPPRAAPPRRLLSIAAGRIPMAQLYGTDKQINWATQIRGRLLSEARRSGDTTALVILKAVTDAHYFCQQADRTLEHIVWPKLHELELPESDVEQPADVAPGPPVRVGRSAEPEDLRRRTR